VLRAMNHDELLHRWIPYRMRAVDTLNYALRLRSSWADAPPMTMHVDGKQVMEGNLNAFTNPAIEAGLVHCRALLELLGLCERKGRLSNKRSRQPGDIGIEHFSDGDRPLKMVDPEIAVSRYNGSREEAEEALLTIFRVTNKGLAHITEDLANHPERGRLTEIASRGVPALVINYLYIPLGLEAPDYKISSRPREA
jgi:hypothetical protein